MTDVARVSAILSGDWRDVPCSTPECGNVVHVHQLTFADGHVVPDHPRCTACVGRALATEAAAQPKARQNAPVPAGATFVVPPLYRDTTFGSFVLWGSGDEQKAQRMALRTMKAYAERFPAVPGIVLLRGNNGTGKGHLSWAVARTIADKGYQVSVVKFATMIRVLRSSWRNGDEPSEEKQLRAYRSPDLLIVDEVSRHAFYGDNVSQHLYDVVNERIEQCKPVILTTDETVAGVRGILGPALVDRLEGAGGTLDFNWRSFRTHGRKEVQGKP